MRTKFNYPNYYAIGKSKDGEKRILPNGKSNFQRCCSYVVRPWRVLKGFNLNVLYDVWSELEKRPQPQPPRSSEELEDLHKLLHFPEEVALRLTETEYQLFYQIPPEEYLRHVAQDQNTKSPARPPPSPSRSYCNPSTTNSSTQTEEESNWPVSNLFSSVRTLIKRFNEVIFRNILR